MFPGYFFREKSFGLLAHLFPGKQKKDGGGQAGEGVCFFCLILPRQNLQAGATSTPVEVHDMEEKNKIKKQAIKIPQAD